MFTKNELKVINIVDGVFHRHMIFEERGVAAYPARDIISKIIGYCNQYIRNNEPTDTGYTTNKHNGEKIGIEKYEFIIPSEIVQGIFWIENPSFFIDLRNIMTNNIDGLDMPKPKGKHYTHPYEKLNSNNTKLETCEIDIICYAINGQVLNSSIETTLYHELNHSYDNFNRIIKYDEDKKQYINDNGLFYYDKHDKLNNLQGYVGDDKNKEAIVQLYYRLMIPTEFNVLYSQVYSELKGINSNNYNHDIEKIDSYKIYNTLKNTYLPIVERMKLDEWQEFMNLVGIRNVTAEKYRKNFINKCNFKLSDLFKRMAKTASLWYDEKNRVFENKVGINGWMEDDEYKIEGRDSDFSRRFRAINNYLNANNL